MRLKSYNPGAALSLSAGDILIARYLPPFPGVRIVTIILSSEGACETADYRIPNQSTAQFFHREVRIPPASFSETQRTLEELAFAWRGARLDEYEFDPAEYETQHRMSLRFWSEQEEVKPVWYSRRLYRELRIPDVQAEQFCGAFQSAWSQIFAIVEWEEDAPEWSS